MEVVLQWLDDLEDVFFALPLAWERLRTWCLNVGLASALMLSAVQVSRVLTELAPTFAAAAFLSVVIWSTGVAMTEISGLRNVLVRSDTPPTS